MSKPCSICGSWAINEHSHGRTPGVDSELCDVCYWRKRAESAQELYQALENANKLITQLMPGIKHIVLQDYGFLNDALLQITTALTRAKGE